MNSLECIRTRRSVRKFTEQKVPHELLEELVETARFAPSWKNTQIVRYIAVEDAALKARIAEEATIPWNAAIIGGAPVLMVLTYLEGRCGYERDGSFSTTKGDRWQNFDCGVAAQTLALPPTKKGSARSSSASSRKRSWRSCWNCPRGRRSPALSRWGIRRRNLPLPSARK